MSEQFKDIDTSPIKSLVKLKQEKDRIKAFMEQATKLQEKVDKTVFERVTGDYASRHAELDMKAEPLKSKAREEYRKLTMARSAVEVAFEEARVDKEELEFRHAVGELGQKELGAKLKDAETVLATRQTELGEADKLKKQFIEAFDSEEDLIAEDIEPDSEEDAFEDEPAGPDTADANDPYRTGFAPVEESPDGDDDRHAGATFVLPEASLVSIDEEGAESEQYPLGAFNYIGRTEENQIRLALPGVSRKHALLTATDRGFTLKDLGSQNGTYVNEGRIEETALEDGDLITIGDVTLRFRLGAG